MFSLHNLQRPAFITEESSVYCAVRPGPLNRMDYVSSFNGYLRHVSTFIKGSHQGNIKYLQEEWSAKNKIHFFTEAIQFLFLQYYRVVRAEANKQYILSYMRNIIQLFSSKRKNLL